MPDIQDKMEALKKKACEALDEYVKKDQWKREDLEGAKDAVKLYNEACDAQMKQGIWDEMRDDWSKNSGYRMPSPHGYSKISYGSHPMHDDRMQYEDSYGRRPMYYDDGYSGHSVKDRMIAALEAQMDSAKTEYEREEVRRAIAEIEKMKR